MATKKLLLVDDDQDLVLSIRPILEKEGWEVHTSFSAEQAKTMAVNNKSDLIVMDIIMEGEHGYSAIEELMSNPQFENVPVIIFSSVTHRWAETSAHYNEDTCVVRYKNPRLLRGRCCICLQRIKYPSLFYRCYRSFQTADNRSFPSILCKG